MFAVTDVGDTYSRRTGRTRVQIFSYYGSIFTGDAIARARLFLIILFSWWQKKARELYERRRRSRAKKNPKRTDKWATMRTRREKNVFAATNDDGLQDVMNDGCYCYGGDGAGKTNEHEGRRQASGMAVYYMCCVGKYCVAAQ